MTTEAYHYLRHLGMSILVLQRRILRQGEVKCLVHGLRAKTGLGQGSWLGSLCTYSGGYRRWEQEESGRLPDNSQSRRGVLWRRAGARESVQCVEMLRCSRELTVCYPGRWQEESHKRAGSHLLRIFQKLISLPSETPILCVLFLSQTSLPHLTLSQPEWLLSHSMLGERIIWKTQLLSLVNFKRKMYGYINT